VALHLAYLLLSSLTSSRPSFPSCPILLVFAHTVHTPCFALSLRHVLLFLSLLNPQLLQPLLLTSSSVPTFNSSSRFDLPNVSRVEHPDWKRSRGNKENFSPANTVVLPRANVEESYFSGSPFFLFFDFSLFGLLPEQALPVSFFRRRTASTPRRDFLFCGFLTL